MAANMAANQTSRRAKSTEPRRIDWGSAEIEGDVLTVQLTGEAVKGWAKDLAGVLALLEQSNQRWGAVRIAKHEITVAEVQEGAEGDLRHFLESVVLQVNSDLGLQAVSKDTREVDLRTRSDDSGSEDRSRRAADRQMAAAFRGFDEADA
jgi:hypothetical protein